ncbi:MAG TPA: DUF692 domain-containing protein [Candidatus Xenobia bacterium]
MSTLRWNIPDLGLGLGLRREIHQAVLDQNPPVGFFEVFPENYMFTEGRPMTYLEQVAERWPMTLHCLQINVGSTDPLDRAYLDRLATIARHTRAVYISDHLAWTTFGGYNLHEVLPVPYTEESLRHVAGRIRQVQDVLERPLFIENSTGYLAYRQSTMSEGEFLARLSVEADCGLLLDVNNAYINGTNHGFDPADLIQKLPSERIGYVHVAGHATHGTSRRDTHDQAVAPAVWELYRLAEEHTGGRTTLLEWDARVPPLPDLCKELAKTLPLLSGRREKAPPDPRLQPVLPLAGGEAAE